MTTKEFYRYMAAPFTEAYFWVIKMLPNFSGHKLPIAVAVDNVHLPFDYVKELNYITE